MGSSSSTALAKELADNTAWLRRVARALVGEAGADDLVQETLEVALRHPPATDRPIRAWLRTVLRNAARMDRRSESRRRRRDESVPAGEPPESPEASLARLETQRRVVQAVIALEEPYRQTLILRYVDDLSPAEIARKLDLPPGTIRSRIHRGLEMLRADLDRDSKSWRLALTPLALSGEAVPAVAPILTGAFIMKTVVAAIAVVIALVVLAARSGTTSSNVDTGAGDRGSVVAPADYAESPGGAADRAPETRAPSRPGSPRRFRDPVERARFADALAQARRRAGERPTRTYDFAGTEVSRSAPPVPAPPRQGVLDKDYIRERISEIRPLLAECYDLARAGDPSLAGKLTVDFVIEAEEEVGGYVSEASIPDESPLKEPLLSECVTETILSLEFVPPEAGGTVRVRYPFLFQTGEP